MITTTGGNLDPPSLTFRFRFCKTAVVSKGKDKGKARGITLIAPQAAYRYCRCAVRLKQNRPIVRSPSQRTRTLTCSQTTIRSPGLPFMVSTRWPMDYHSFTDPGGMV